MVMSSDINNEFINAIKIANIAAEAFGKTHADSIEQALIELHLMGEFNLADNFEEGLKKINEK
jgi:hypothetical protein